MCYRKERDWVLMENGCQLTKQPRRLPLQQRPKQMFCQQHPPHHHQVKRQQFYRKLLNSQHLWQTMTKFFLTHNCRWEMAFWKRNYTRYCIVYNRSEYFSPFLKIIWVMLLNSAWSKCDFVIPLCHVFSWSNSIGYPVLMLASTTRSLLTKRWIYHLSERKLEIKFLGWVFWSV